MPVTFIPFVANAGTHFVNSGTDEPSGMAAALFERMRSDPGQKRVNMTWHPLLAHAAQAHCEDMVRRGYFGHESPEHVWPNKRARLAGYDVVPWFEDDRNNIESIGAGYETVGELWQAWLLSPLHRLHVLGEESYAIQTNVGCGWAAMVDAPLFKTCWAMVSAPVEA